MKKVIFGLLAIGTLSTLVLPAQAQEIKLNKTQEVVSENNLKGYAKRRHHRHHHRYAKVWVCRYDYYGKKICFWTYR